MNNEPHNIETHKRRKHSTSHYVGEYIGISIFRKFFVQFERERIILQNFLMQMIR